MVPRAKRYLRWRVVQQAYHGPGIRLRGDLYALTQSAMLDTIIVRCTNIVYSFEVLCNQQHRKSDKHDLGGRYWRKDHSRGRMNSTGRLHSDHGRKPWEVVFRNDIKRHSHNGIVKTVDVASGSAKRVGGSSRIKAERFMSESILR